MTKNKWYLVSVFSTVAAVSVAAAHDGGPGHFAHFAKADKNADGVLTTAEFESSLLERWTSSDANKDGKVTADEFKAQFAQHKQERFAKRDTNANGVLERSEVERMPSQLFTKIDSDKSGTLSKEELANKPLHHGKHFGDMKKLPGDADGDGVVTKAEAVSGAAQFAKRLDANADGKLTKDEFMPRGRGHHHCGSHAEQADAADQTDAE